MNKTTVSATAISAEDSINNSLFTFGAVWALSLGYLPIVMFGLMALVGK